MEAAVLPVAKPLSDNPEAPPIESGGSGYTIVILIVRVLLNIHPWLTGLSALRIGRFAVKQGSTTACIGPYELVVAVMPAALIHALYDFLLLTVPLLGVLAVPVLWYASRRYFMSTWEELKPADADADPT